MLYPSIFTNNLFDDIFDDLMRPAKSLSSFGSQSVLMKTDIRETKDAYFLDVELPGVKKENVTVELKDGALEIKAVTAADDADKEENGKYLRRERFYGSCSRSFYVGEELTKEDIKARFENGVLVIDVPKKEPQAQVETPSYIAIE